MTHGINSKTQEQNTTLWLLNGLVSYQSYFGGFWLGMNIKSKFRAWRKTLVWIVKYLRKSHIKGFQTVTGIYHNFFMKFINLHFHAHALPLFVTRPQIPQMSLQFMDAITRRSWGRNSPETQKRPSGHLEHLHWSYRKAHKVCQRNYRQLWQISTCCGRTEL